MGILHYYLYTTDDRSISNKIICTITVYLTINIVCTREKSATLKDLYYATALLGGEKLPNCSYLLSENESAYAGPQLVNTVEHN